MGGRRQRFAGYELLCTAIRVTEERAQAGDQVALELFASFHGVLAGFTRRWPQPKA